MSWQTDSFPKKSDIYLVTIQTNRKGHMQVFIAIAEFDADSDRWYKNDPLAAGPKEEIPAQEITAWRTLPPVYIK